MNYDVSTLGCEMLANLCNAAACDHLKRDFLEPALSIEQGGSARHRAYRLVKCD